VNTAASRPDPLLRITRLLLGIVKVLAAIACVAAAGMVPGIWVIRPDVLLRPGVPQTEALMAGSYLAVAMAVFAALAFLFIRRLIAIIDTVGEGSPFIPENANRLRAMAWIVLASQAVALACTPVTVWMIEHVPKFQAEIAFDFSGVISALLLFVLARVFELGTRLAEDVEGTV
jgi:Protein of unknown function (DUF2975)